MPNNRKCMTCNRKVKDLVCAECFYCSAAFHLDCVKTLAAEKGSDAFDTIDQNKDVFFCIRCVHERTSKVQMVGAGMLDAAWFGFEGAACIKSYTDNPALASGLHGSCTGGLGSFINDVQYHRLALS